MKSIIDRIFSIKALVALMIICATSGAWAVYSPGETITWSNTGTANAVSSTIYNECNFDFCIPASDDLPAGSVVRINSIKLASLNESFQGFATGKNSDPYKLKLNGVVSGIINGAADQNADNILTSDNLIASNGSTNDRAALYTFSTACDVVVGRKYSAVTGNNVGGAGDGVAFVHSNGDTKLVYGSSTDYGAVRYVQSNDSSSILTPFASTDETNGKGAGKAATDAGYYPIYEITATVVSIPALPWEFDYDVAAGTVMNLSARWPTAVNNTYSDNMRLGSNGSSLIYDLDNGAGYQSFNAMTEAFTFALYADVYRMSSTSRSVLIIFGNNGASSNKLILYRDGANIKMGFYDGSYNLISGTTEVSVAAPTDAKFHLITATCDPTTGALSLYVDNGTGASGSNSATPDPTVSVSLAEGFQLGNVKGGGLGGGFVTGAGCAVERMLGFDVALSSAQVATLAGDYPSIADNVISADVNFDKSGKTLYLYDSAAQGNQFLGGKYGTVTIAAGNTISVPHIRTLNADGATMTMNFAGTVNVTAASQSTIDKVYDQRGSYNGLLFGHWNGGDEATYNITGAINAENAYMATVFGSAMQTFNVNGGTLKVKGLYAYNNNSTINLSNNGLIQVGEVTSGGSPIIRNFGAGTYKVTADATETRAINFNAPDGSYTKLDPVANTLTLNAAAVTGAGDIDVAPSGAGKVIFSSLTDSYSGDIKISSGSAAIQGASGYTGSVAVNAPLAISNASDAELSVLSGSSNITKTGAGSLTITGTGTYSGLVEATAGKVVFSGPEAKLGSNAYFNLKGGALDIIPGSGETITLTPQYLINSTQFYDAQAIITVGPGTVRYSRDTGNTNAHGCFAGSNLRIVNGGTLDLDYKDSLGWNKVTPLSIATGGKLVVSKRQTLTRAVTLSGGTIELVDSDTDGRALDIFTLSGSSINVTADSTIQASSAGTVANPEIWFRSATPTIDISNGATLFINACIDDGSSSDYQGRGLTKTGAGTLALNGYNGNGYTYTGTTTISAGTLAINATQSGSAYSLAAGTTLKFGSGANLSVPSITLPETGTVTVDVSDLTLSASGTTLITFTSAPSAEDVANKMTVSGAVLRLEDSALKAYPVVATLTKSDDTVVPFVTVQEAVNATVNPLYAGYKYITVNVDDTMVDAVDMTLKVKYGVGVSSLTVNSPFAEYVSDGGVVDGESGITTYSLTATATTYTWAASGVGVKNWTTPANWTYGSGTPAPATRYPTTCDTVVFNDGANVTLDSSMTVAGIAVNGAVSISGSAKSLNTSGNITGDGTLTLSDICLASVGAELTVSPSVNFTNDSELARVTSGKLILNGDITASGTFKSWDVTHTVNGDLSIASGVNMAIGTGLEVKGSTTFNGNFSKSQGGTLTLGNVRVAENTAISISNGSIAITGTVTIDPGVTLSLPSSGVTFSGASFAGSGKVALGALSGSQLSFDSGWTGTVVLPYINGTDGGFYFNRYGKAGSTVEIANDFTGWLNTSSEDTRIAKANVVVNAGKTFTISGSNSSAAYGLTKLSGAGNFAFRQTNAPGSFTISTLEDFTGTISNSIGSGTPTAITITKVKLASAPTPGLRLVNTDTPNYVNVSGVYVGEVAQAVNLIKKSDGIYVAATSSVEGSGAAAVTTIATSSSDSQVEVSVNVGDDYTGTIIVPANVTKLATTGTAVADGQLKLKVNYGVDSTAIYENILTRDASGYISLTSDADAAVGGVKVTPEIKTGDAENPPMAMSGSVPAFSAKAIPGLWYAVKAASSEADLGDKFKYGTPVQAVGNTVNVEAPAFPGTVTYYRLSAGMNQDDVTRYIVSTNRLAVRPTTDGLFAYGENSTTTTAAHDCYRIPAIASTWLPGDAGDPLQAIVMGIYDARTSYWDLGQRMNKTTNERQWNNNAHHFAGIDIAGNYSLDGGASWSDVQIMIDVPNAFNPATGTDNKDSASGIDKAYDIGDPAIVYVPETEKFLMMGITGGGNSSVSNITSNAMGADLAMYECTASSVANGAPAWQKVASFTKEGVIALLKAKDGTLTFDYPPNGYTFDYDSTRPWTRETVYFLSILQGPGNALVTREDCGSIKAGTIVFPMQYCAKKRKTDDNYVGISYTFALYSTDNGATWNVTGVCKDEAAYGSECCIAQLDDGSLLMEVRPPNASTKRAFFRSTDFNTWTKACELVESAGPAEGSILRIGAKDGKSVYACSFTTGATRADLQLFIGTDYTSDEDVANVAKGINWTTTPFCTIWKGDTGTASTGTGVDTVVYGYSSLVMLDETTLGVLSEAHGHIYFTKIDVSSALK